MLILNGKEKSKLYFRKEKTAFRKSEKNNNWCFKDIKSFHSTLNNSYKSYFQIPNGLRATCKNLIYFFEEKKDFLCVPYNPA